MDGGLCGVRAARPTGTAYDPIPVRRAAISLHAAFRPHVAVTPLRFANPSPPSSWIRDSHPQVGKHAWQTQKNGPHLAVKMRAGNGFRVFWGRPDLVLLVLHGGAKTIGDFRQFFFANVAVVIRVNATKVLTQRSREFVGVQFAVLVPIQIHHAGDKRLGGRGLLGRGTFRGRSPRRATAVLRLQRGNRLGQLNLADLAVAIGVVLLEVRLVLFVVLILGQLAVFVLVRNLEDVLSDLGRVHCRTTRRGGAGPVSISTAAAVMSVALSVAVSGVMTTTSVWMSVAAGVTVLLFRGAGLRAITRLGLRARLALVATPALVATTRLLGAAV